MEAILEYKVMSEFGHDYVVAFSEREEAFFNKKLTDEKGNAILDENGKQKKEKIILMEAPSYMDMKGLVLCGVLRKNETLDEWIEKERIKKAKQ